MNNVEAFDGWAERLMKLGAHIDLELAIAVATNDP